MSESAFLFWKILGECGKLLHSLKGLFPPRFAELPKKLQEGNLLLGNERGAVIAALDGNIIAHEPGFIDVQSLCQQINIVLLGFKIAGCAALFSGGHQVL